MPVKKTMIIILIAVLVLCSIVVYKKQNFREGASSYTNKTRQKLAKTMIDILDGKVEFVFDDDGQKESLWRYENKTNYKYDKTVNYIYNKFKSVSNSDKYKLSIPKSHYMKYADMFKNTKFTYNDNLKNKNKFERFLMMFVFKHMIYGDSNRR